jgi:hypothetical protein
MKQVVLLVVSVSLALGAGCARLDGAAGNGQWQDVAPPDIVPPPRPEAGARVVMAAPRGARTAEAFDRTSEAEKAAALAAPANGQTLGKVTVSLGNPAEQGFWMKSALVSTRTEGIVRLPDGKSVQVDLLPLTGGGPQLSLAAFRALDLPLTALPEVTVLRR